MAYACNNCHNSIVTVRNGQLQCARCGSPVLDYSVEEEINYKRLLQRANTFYTISDFNNALSIYAQLKNLRPQDYIPYLGMAASMSRGYKNFDSFVEVYRLITSAQCLLPYGKSVPTEIRNFISMYKQKLDKKNEEAEEKVQLNYILAIMSLISSIVFTSISILLSLLLIVLFGYFMKRNFQINGNVDQLKKAKKEKIDFDSLMSNH